MNNTKAKKKVTGLCILLSAVLLSGTVSAAPLPTGLEAAGVAAALNGGQADAESKSAATAGVAASFNLNSLVPEQESEHAAVLALEARRAATAELYKDVAISQVNNYVNIRSEADAESEILGKIYNNAAGYIKETVEKDDGTWYRVKSGSVDGYIKAEYFVTGEDAEDLAKEVGKMVATIKTDSLRLREAPALDSKTIDVISSGEKYTVSEEMGEFIKLSIDSDLTGYVYRDYVDIDVEFKEAISIEEERAEQERLAELERQRLEAEEEMRREQEEREQRQTTTAKKKTTASSKDKETTKSTTKATAPEAPKSDGSSSGTRSAIVAYAQSFVGNLEYVYGGNSLVTGTDCSGFVKLIYAKYGISLPRTSGSQAGAGYEVSEDDMQPGDILYYGNHVAIYIGDGKVVHASNEQDDVKISRYNYRDPHNIRNVID